MSKTWYGHHIDTIKGEDYVLFKDYLELDKEIERLKKELLNKPDTKLTLETEDEKKYTIIQTERIDMQEELNKSIEKLLKENDKKDNIINELEKYHIKSMKNLENTEDFKYIGINHTKILYEEHKRALERIKELKEGKYENN